MPDATEVSTEIIQPRRLVHRKQAPLDAIHRELLAYSATAAYRAAPEALQPDALAGEPASGEES